MKLFATALLVLMAVIYCISRILLPRYPFLGFVAAFSEAGTVGALADWFAVVALFRHPLNLPIPRTGVIPRNRDRIGESLARFFNVNFLTKDLLEKKMASVDLAGLLAAWLADERNAHSLRGPRPNTPLPCFRTNVKKNMTPSPLPAGPKKDLPTS